MIILKVPFSAGGLGKTDGCEEGPDKIQASLGQPHLTEHNQYPLFEWREAEVRNSEIDASHESIRKAVLAALGSPLVLVGGDHSITYSSFVAFASKHPQAGLIVFDAHPDLQADFQPPTHEAYLAALIEKGVLDPKKVVIVGTRNWSVKELEFSRTHGLKVFGMPEIAREGVDEVCEAVMSIARGWESAYVSIDIDVLDPAFAPGTGHPEAGGMTTRELLRFIYRLKRLKNIGMFDLVEYNPRKDNGNITLLAAKKLLMELY